MSTVDSSEAETMPGAFQMGYSRKQVIQSVALALALHAAIVGAYLVLGSEKTPPQGKIAAKEEKKGDDAKAASKAPDAKSDAPKGESGTAAAGAGESAKSPDKPKGAEASKASELPASPDSDIDAILKSK